MTDSLNDLLIEWSKSIEIGFTMAGAKGHRVIGWTKSYISSPCGLGLVMTTVYDKGDTELANLSLCKRCFS